jgi:hypothetical protein
MSAEGETSKSTPQNKSNDVIVISDNESEAGGDTPLPTDTDDGTGDSDNESAMSEADGEGVHEFTPVSDDDSPSSGSGAVEGNRSLFALTAKRALTAWKVEMLRLSSTSADGLLRIKIEQISTMALFDLGDRIMRELAKRQRNAPVVVDMTDDSD